jgi:UDP-N-acetylmuramoylalanine--D-glutamate ligase
MTIAELSRYKTILILGYGIEGHATERFLKKSLPNTTIMVADKKDGDAYLARQHNVDLVVRSPGIPLTAITRASTTATNIFFANCPGTIIGVTGTKGKSTTTSLIAAMLKEKYSDVRLVGNIGSPMLDALDGATAETYFVVELSSYQLADCRFSPHIAVVVNWYPEHLDFHGSFDAYKKAKQNIFIHQKPGDFFVFDPHEPEVASWAALTAAKPTPYASVTMLAQSANPLLGPHNVRNIEGACTAAGLCGVPSELCMQGLATFSPLRHRLQLVGEFAGIRFYDDAISTTPQSTIAALQSITQISMVFLGGLDRGYDFQTLAQELAARTIPHLVLFPQTGARIRAEVEKISGYSPTFFETTSMEQAVAHAYAVCPQGTACLLSTASPSYSLWKNFEEKGDLFQQFVTHFSHP